MASLNKVLLIGNLTRDPDVRMMSNGRPVCNFGLALIALTKTLKVIAKMKLPLLMSSVSDHERRLLAVFLLRVGLFSLKAD